MNKKYFLIICFLECQQNNIFISPKDYRNAAHNNKYDYPIQILINPVIQRPFCLLYLINNRNNKIYP